MPPTSFDFLTKAQLMKLAKYLDIKVSPQMKKEEMLNKINKYFDTTTYTWVDENPPVSTMSVRVKRIYDLNNQENIE